MPERRPPKDSNQLAKYIVDVTSGKTKKIDPPKTRSKQSNPRTSNTSSKRQKIKHS